MSSFRDKIVAKKDRKAPKRYVIIVYQTNKHPPAKRAVFHMRA